MHDFGFPKMSSFGVKSPGHEGAGVVVKVGANVKNWKVGDRGGVKPVWDVCGCCDLCWGDKEAYCPDAVFTGLAKVSATHSRGRLLFPELILILDWYVPTVYRITCEIYLQDSRWCR